MLAIATASLLVACAGIRHVAHDQHSKIVLSENDMLTIKTAVTEDLFDPYSAHLEDVTAGKDIAKPGLITFCGQLNAKNRMGGYTGKQTFYGNLRAGKVTFLLRHDDERLDAELNCLGFYDSLSPTKDGVNAMAR